jgi:hypothetical protein
MTSTPLFDDSFCDHPNTCVQFSERRESVKISMKLRFTSRILNQHYFFVVMTERKFKAFFIYIGVQTAISVSKLMRCEIEDRGSIPNTTTNFFHHRYMY